MLLLLYITTKQLIVNPEKTFQPLNDRGNKEVCAMNLEKKEMVMARN